MRRYVWIALFVLTPLTTYECLEKCAEHLTMTGGLYTLSLQAERDTRWTLRGHGNVFDRARHELAESRRFYVLAGFRLVERISG